MATSGTNTWKPNIEEITVEAYERCQFNPQNLTQRDAVSARFSMNLMYQWCFAVQALTQLWIE